MSRSDGTGVTVSSEYGYRTFATKKQKHKGKARKASRKKQRR